MRSIISGMLLTVEHVYHSVIAFNYNSILPEHNLKSVPGSERNGVKRFWMSADGIIIG
jgi:hypothetical protein